MKFGSFKTADADGLILAHTLKTAKFVLKKGHVVTSDTIAMLLGAGITEVVGAKLEAGDVAEDDAAARIARQLAGSQVTLSAARTGRCNLVAAREGVVRVDAKVITAANLISESVTIATLGDKQAVAAGQIVATVKIIPFAVAGQVMMAVARALGDGAVTLAPYLPKRFSLISTTAHNLKASVMKSTEEITRQRITSLGGTTVSTCAVPHAASAVESAVREVLKEGADIILVTGASATVDRDDVIPAGIVAAGGDIDHFGMPVDPGNLLVLAHVGAVPILVLPGCARSPKLNGVDWVMQRLAAGIAVGPMDIMKMGVGGLLVDTPGRPLPRESAVQPASAAPPRITAVVLAAGQSRRMGPSNKLLMEIDGMPLIRRTAQTLLSSDVNGVVVVTGHQDDEVRAALSGLDVTIVHNPRYAEGLSTTLKVGIGALGPDTSAALIGLGDMPAVRADHVNCLIAGFDPEAGRSIGVPVHHGKRGNPVLWARRFFEDMRGVSGDVGAKALIGANESLVYQVEFEDTGVLTDLDTPEQWSDFLAKSDK